MISKNDAIRLLVSGNLSFKADGSVNYMDEQTPPTEAEIDAKLKSMQDDYVAKQYQRDRKYPSIQEQLDMMYWDRKNETNKWEESVDKVKPDNPKPS